MKRIPLCVLRVLRVVCGGHASEWCLSILVRVHAWCGFLVRVNGAGAW